MRDAGPQLPFPSPVGSRFQCSRMQGRPKELFLKKMFLYKIRGQEFPFFLVFIYVLLFSTETLPFYLYVLFSMALGKDLSVPRK